MDGDRTENAAALACLTDGVLLESVKDEAVLMHIERGAYYSLNAVGARMVALALRLPDVESVVRTLGEEYEADADTLRRDLSRLLSELVAEDLLGVREGGISPPAGGNR